MICMVRPPLPNRLIPVLTSAFFILLPPTAHAQGTVDLHLALAVDASGSVDDARFELQRKGYAAAFRHDRVLEQCDRRPGRIHDRREDFDTFSDAILKRIVTEIAMTTRPDPTRLARQ
jgi:Protein of unknown function (DUF1194)